MKKKLMLKTKTNIQNKSLVKALLAEFDWDFENNLNKYHPVMTGNCRQDGAYHHGVKIASGDLIKGEYNNAAYVCNHCYCGNPARLEWDENKIVLIADELNSSKHYRTIWMLKQKCPEILQDNLKEIKNFLKNVDFDESTLFLDEVGDSINAISTKAFDYIKSLKQI